MYVHALVMLLAVQLPVLPGQQTQQQTAAALAPSPVARVVIQPSTRTITAGDTVRLRAQPLDASGNPVPNASVRFNRAGGFFEGTVDTTGLVSSGSTGTLPVAVVVTVPGTQPFVERLDIKMVAGPATQILTTEQLTRMVAGQRFRFGAQAVSAAGDRREDAIIWKSSNPAVLRIGNDGLAVAQTAGRVTVTASSGGATTSFPVQVVANTIASIDITPATGQARQGDMVRFKAIPKDAAGKTITGLTPTWTFSPGQGQMGTDGGFVGYEPGEYTVTANFGNRSADATVRLSPRDVRRPVSVVGRLPRKLFTTEELWIHPNGNVAYLGTGSGGDRMYTIDISNPANPNVTDSIVANTRRVNDIMTTPDGKFLVFTREGASDRKNGIVFASLEDPLHPKVISEFTEGVTAGVHSSFVYSQPKFGTHVYITNDGTGAMHVIDINDPYNPKEVAQWRTARPDAGRSLHDVDIKDGLAYLAYWNDGLIILDVGNGIKGGSPSNPVLVSQHKYDLNSLYRDVEAASGPGFIRGTHTAWKHKNYVFIADEVFPAGGVKGAKDAAAGRAYGRLQVIDVSDLEKPKSVAWYEPEFGGVHNVWVAGDTLYIGAYNAGFHAFDISGELRGDLRAQGREIASLNTADMEGKVQNTAMTWGVVVNPKDGLAYVNDMYNGLWVVRLEPKRNPVIP
jgi:hypothetical protein